MCMLCEHPLCRHRMRVSVCATQDRIIFRRYVITQVDTHMNVLIYEQEILL